MVKIQGTTFVVGALAQFIGVWAVTPTPAPVFQVSNTKCTGQQLQRDQCLGPPCNGCVPKDCQYSGWTGWVKQNGCNGLQVRRREIAQQNNECGTACTENLRESQTVAQPASCTDPNQDCEANTWTPWSTCLTRFGQSSRSKNFVMRAHGTGTGCNNTMNQTRPCGQKAKQVNCTFAAWGDWTKCSAECGGGWQSRYRRFNEKSTFLGTPCEGVMNMFRVCANNSCAAPRDCVWAKWTEWAGCDVTDKYQMVRRRSVEVPPLGQKQKPCEGSTRETQGCDYAGTFTPVNCDLSEWSNYGPCTKSCEGGQRTRYRVLNTPPKDGGHCATKDLVQTDACNQNPCKANVCVYTDWAGWEPCSMPCGPGTTRRARAVDLERTVAEEGGCTGTLKEIKSCKLKDCLTSDCLWADWQGWSGCTASCGGGTKRRHRYVVTSPVNGGTWCLNNSKAEVTPCNRVPCQSACVNGLWHDWTAWSPCSKSCGGAYQSRHRTVAVAATPCGTPVEGKFDDFRECPANPPCIPPVDCQLSSWAAWSACSGSCFGIRQRTRTIRQFAANFGAACEGVDKGVLKVVEGCNPGPGQPVDHSCDATPARDCVLENWGTWTTCPVTCGGGQEYRQRHILSPPSHSGKPCTEAIGETRPCQGAGQKTCERVCIDCEWQQWSEWGACTSCAGQKWRTRNVQKHPNYCGKQCVKAVAKEVTNCTCAGGEGSGLFCSWTPWTPFEGCSAQCGPATKKSQRTLHLTNAEPSAATGGYLFKGKAPLTCSGTQFNSTACPLIECPALCTKTDCQFHGWSNWHDNRCTGLATRHRNMATLGRCGGAICNGSLIESKVVPVACNIKTDCIWNQWGAWTSCHKSGQQSHRSRAVYKMPQAGGKPCNGSMVDTKPCVVHNYQPVNCTFQEWFPWSHCSVSCGVGWQMRNRATIPSTNNGFPCVGKLKEIQACDQTNEALCGLAPIGVACEFDAWSTWSMCLATGERNRVRHIVTMGRFGSPACNGSIEELGSCGPGIQDCVLSEWTPYDKCDRTCGGGQQQRNRQINLPAEGGGVACDTHLVETQACGKDICPAANCVMSEWTPWTKCTATCGNGQQSRSRSVNKPMGEGGQGCSGHLVEQQQCAVSMACANADCAYGAWTAWDACDKQCGGGQQARHRDIIVAAQSGGAACPIVPIAEQQPCNTGKCTGVCQDGVFALWTAWSKCSTTCMGGIQMRTRKIQTRASSCGNPVNGSTHEVAACWTKVPCEAPPVNCAWGDWQGWTACSATCLGERSRSRAIATQGKGGGTFCTGPLMQTEPCNPGAADTLPASCPTGMTPVDCKQSPWGPLSGCPVTCGGGQQTKTRTIIQHPRLGGEECPEKYMAWTQPCNVQLCTNNEVDCAYAEWSTWSGCDSCNGQRSRTRSFTHPTTKGRACNASAPLGETEQCILSRNCAGQQHYCNWEGWGAWTQCTFSSSAQCGTGYKTRTRNMIAQTTPPAAVRLYDASLEEIDTDIPAEVDDEQAGRLRALASAFVGGASTVGLCMFALRLAQRASRPSGSPYVAVSSDAGVE